MLVPGTDIVRIGVLATLADVVAGQPPLGVISPTTDLSVHVARVRPVQSIDLVSWVRKEGATLVVTETHLMADGEEQPFATSLATFMNRRLHLEGRLRPPHEPLVAPVHARIGAQVLRPSVVEIEPRDDLANGHHGTIQGGVISMLAELAVESTFEGEPVAVTGLDVRFLNRVKVGPARAVARALTRGVRGIVFSVSIVDAGNDDRPVAQVAAWAAPLEVVREG